MNVVAIAEHFTNILRSLTDGVCHTPTSGNIDAARYLIEQTRSACDECTAKINKAAVERPHPSEAANPGEAKP